MIAVGDENFIEKSPVCKKSYIKIITNIFDIVVFSTILSTFTQNNSFNYYNNPTT